MLKLRSLSYATRASLLMLAQSAAFAEPPQNLVFGGVQVAEKSSYAYAAAIMPFSDAALGRGWYQKTLLSWSSYRYDGTLDGNTTEIKAAAPGIEAGFGHAWGNENSGIDLSATLGYRHVRLTPFAPAGDQNGNVFTLTPQIQARTKLSAATEGELLANYAIGPSNLFARARLAWLPVAGWRTGIEGVWQDEPNYAVSKQGLFVSKALDNRMVVELSAGQAKPQKDSASAYIGIAISRVY